MQNRTITNLVLGIALAALAAFIYFELQDDPADDHKLVKGLTLPDVVRLAIKNVRNEHIVLEKLNGQWQLTHPFIAAANRSRIENLLGIINAQSQNSYATNEADLDQLKLTKPDIHLQINDVELDIGATEPIEQRRYIMIRDRIHLITDNFSFLAQGSATDFVDNQLLSGEPRLVKLQLPDFTLEKAEQIWTVTGRDPQPNPDLIQQFLDDWRLARALKLSHVEPSTLLANIRLEFQDLPAIEYNLSHTDKEFLLTRLDNGLVYHLTTTSGSRLLTLPTKIEDGKE